MVEQIIIPLVMLAIMIVVIAGGWKTYTKANQPGWGILIPFYNWWLLVKISDNSALWFVLFLVPIANIIAMFKVNIDVADNFGKGLGFGLGLVFLPFIFYPLLGFGDAQYQGRAEMGGRNQGQAGGVQ